MCVVCMYCVGTCASQFNCGSQRTATGSQVSPVIMCSLGIKPRSSGLARNTFIYSDTWVAYIKAS